MADREVAVARPRRWAEPLDDRMRDVDVDRLLRLEPFCRIDPADFPSFLPLRGILRNDARIRRLRPGELIFREGDYGSSVYLILHGHVRVVLDRLPPAALGRELPRPQGWLATIARLATRSRFPEVRRQAGPNGGSSTAAAPPRDAPRRGLFVADLPAVLDASHTAVLSAGEFFGESAALTRTPRAVTAYSDGETTLLELRWQGLRDLMQRTRVIRDHVEAVYRRNSLTVHLRETPFLAQLPPEALQEVADAADFQAYGRFDWHESFDPRARSRSGGWIEDEPLIVEEGGAADAVLLVRSGFARLSRRVGNGHYTLAYLGRGEACGWSETVASLEQGRPVPRRASLRAVGYVDVVSIPAEALARHVLPFLGPAERRSLADGQAAASPESVAALVANGTSAAGAPHEQELLEFLVERRLINGRQAMAIDLDRCTRCDDCVVACAAVHDNNPRFVRQGPRHGPLQIAHACMHCVDPVCMIGCPTGAIGRDEATGVVRINDPTCIGCGSCATSCPYDNIRMVEIRTPAGELWIDEATRQPLLKAAKCDLCADLPGGPACQNACPHDALVRLDLSRVDRVAAWKHRP